MDWLRTTYSCPARFHDDPDAPLVTLRWMWTDQEFQANESAINSKHWADAGERDTVVGEQWTFPPPTRALDLPIGVVGGHQCGEVSDFENGQPWPFEGEPIKYDEDDVPLCCPRYYGLTVPPRPMCEVSVGNVQIWGATCCDAGDAALNVTYTGNVPDAGGGAVVYRYTLPAGNYRTSWGTDFAHFFSTGIDGDSGPACDDTPLTQFAGLSGTYDWTLAVDSVVCVTLIHGDALHPAPYFLLLEALP